MRWSIDEESGSTDYVDRYMDNIITAKIPDAMRWLSLYADASLLGGSGGGANGTLKSWSTIIGEEPAGGDSNETDEEETAAGEPAEESAGNAGATEPKIEGNVIVLPEDFVRLIRVRVSGWRKSVMKTISEDSDEYLMQTDDTAKADGSCPVVALVEDFPCRLELFPTPQDGDTVNITYTVSPTEESVANDGDVVSVPPKMKTAFVYYLAYLVMCAYNDVTKANTMLGVAKTQIGGGSTQTDAG